MTTTAFLSLLAVVNGTCVVLDRVLFVTEREKLKRRLEEATAQLKLLRPHNAPAFVLEISNRTINRVFGDPFYRNPLFWVLISLISITFTTQTLPFDAWLHGRARYQPLAAIHNVSTWVTVAFIFTNLGIDLLVWAVFLFFLSQESWLTRPLRALKVTAITVGILFFVAEKRYGIFYSFIYGFALRNFYLGHRLFDPKENPYIAIQMFGAFFPFTMFLLLSVMAVLFIPLLWLSIAVGRRLVQPMSELPADKLAPFTLVGSVLTVISSAIKFYCDYTHST